MKVKELIKELEEYNPDADIVIGNSSDELTINYGSSDGVKKSTCDLVSIGVRKESTKYFIKSHESV